MKKPACYYLLVHDSTTSRVYVLTEKGLQSHCNALEIKFYSSKFYAVARCMKMRETLTAYIVPVPEGASVDASGALRLSDGETISRTELIHRAGERALTAIQKKENSMKKK